MLRNLEIGLNSIFFEVVTWRTCESGSLWWCKNNRSATITDAVKKVFNCKIRLNFFFKVVFLFLAKL